MMIWGHTLIKRTNSSLYTCSLKLFGRIPSRGKDNYLEGRMRVTKSMGYKVNRLLRAHSEPNDYKGSAFIFNYFRRRNWSSGKLNNSSKLTVCKNQCQISDSVSKWVITWLLLPWPKPTSSLSGTAALASSRFSLLPPMPLSSTARGSRSISVNPCKCKSDRVTSQLRTLRGCPRPTSFGMTSTMPTCPTSPRMAWSLPRFPGSSLITLHIDSLAVS